MIQASLINIGDELLIGQVVNTNAVWIGQQLTEQGIPLRQVHLIPDEEKAIRKTLQRALDESDVVLITGGLGPTKDDITKKVLADFFNTELIFSQQVYEHYSRLSERFGRNVDEEIKRWQSMMPASAELLQNAMGVAPGMWFEREGKIVVSMPGVPVEMKYIMQRAVLPRLQERHGGGLILYRVIRTAITGEPEVAARLADFEETLEANMNLAYLPHLGGVRLRLTARSSEREASHEKALQEQLDKAVSEITTRLGSMVYATEDIELSEVVGNLLRERGLHIATAESCTGGYLAHLITAVPGASNYYLGSVISYANSVKQEVLGVSKTTIQQHGAVSEACVKEMVRGVSELLKSDWALATSGIAGPGGGTPDKPVGTIWVAVGHAKEQEAHLLQLGKDRRSNIAYTSFFALEMLRRKILAT